MTVAVDKSMDFDREAGFALQILQGERLPREHRARNRTRSTRRSRTSRRSASA
jgi:hypothetical protein